MALLGRATWIPPSTALASWLGFLAIGAWVLAQRGSGKKTHAASSTDVEVRPPGASSG